MTATPLLEKTSVWEFKRELDTISGSMAFFSFKKPHICLDCKKPLKTHGAVRCKSCNMRKNTRMKKNKNGEEIVSPQMGKAKPPYLRVNLCDS